MAFNFFNNTIANNLSKTNKQINNAGNINSPKNDNPNMPIDGLINQVNSKKNNAIGIGGEDNQVMGETPWWNWQTGEGEMAGLPGGETYIPPNYGGGNTGSESPPPSAETLSYWQQLYNNMVSSGDIDMYSFDWGGLQEAFFNAAENSSNVQGLYDDFWNLFSSGYSDEDSESSTVEGDEEQTTLADDLVYSPRGKKSAKKLYYGGTGGESSRGFLSQGTI